MNDSPRSRIALLNIVLATIAAISIGHGLYWSIKYRPKIVINPPLECGPDRQFEEWLFSSSAGLIADICSDIINKTGSLPVTTRDRSNLILPEALKRTNWPHEFKINEAGELLDCYGRAFEIAVSSDRVSVTSDSSFTYYFSTLNSKIEKSDR